MIKVTGKTLEENVSVIDVNEVNRWSNIEAEGKRMAAESHDNWHTLYQGTATDQFAHEDMHAEQAEVAKVKRDKACNARSSANNERAALQSQSTAAYSKYLELMKFAEEKEAQVRDRAITS